MGTEVNWNDKTSTIEIKKQTGSTPSENGGDVDRNKPEEKPVNTYNETDGIKETKFEGLPAIEVNGTTYLDLWSYSNLMIAAGSENNYMVWSDNNTKVKIVIGSQENTLYKDKDIVIYKGASYINSKFYVKP
ncbi:hypothetical protein HMPREF1207_05032 [Paenibacillus sp. HGH0039]|nr:hypothetical protein HMPREF1207_05032 [Paenibacillus sp. HGH0039]